MTHEPLPLPDDYDTDRHLLARWVDDKVYHAMVPSVQLAGRLAANGCPQDWQVAADIVAAVLDCQEQGRPHRGNFRWEWEDEAVEDLNAVQFALFYLIPIARHRRLDTALQARLLEGIRHGLEEIGALDVDLDYTNIVLKDIANSCLGGELLGDEATTRRGRDKLVRWIDRLEQHGLPAEYNSPNYAAVAFRVLGQLSALAADRATRVRARTMLWRLGLSAALRLHRRTGRWAGPYSRAYRPAVFCETRRELDEFRAWVDEGLLPEWLLALAEADMSFQVNESAGGPVYLSSYKSDAFALGVASQELKTQEIIFIAMQSNVMIAQYDRAGCERPGILFSRYVLDDKWIGDFRTTPSRASDQLLPEEGRFFGVQDGPRALGVYAPRQLDGLSRCASAKTVLVWTDRRLIDGIWVNGEAVDQLPASVPAGATVVVGSGGLWSAVRPLDATDLGGGAPVRLVELDGHLALEIYNYRGPAKTFWELAYPGSFYQGQPQCGFYLELAERSAWESGQTFGQAVAAGQLTDQATPAFTHRAGRERPWNIAYSRDGRTLGMEVELMEWRLKRRWNQDGVLGYPMLEAPLARQSADGEVAVGEGRFTCRGGSVWLAVSADGDRWVAAYHGSRPATAVLEIPAGRVEVERMGMGVIVWERGEVQVEAVESGAWRYTAAR